MRHVFYSLFFFFTLRITTNYIIEICFYLLKIRKICVLLLNIFILHYLSVFSHIFFWHKNTTFYSCLHFHQAWVIPSQARRDPSPHVGNWEALPWQHRKRNPNKPKQIDRSGWKFFKCFKLKLIIASLIMHGFLWFLFSIT